MYASDIAVKSRPNRPGVHELRRSNSGRALLDAARGGLPAVLQQSLPISWWRPSLVGPSDELGSGAEIQLRQDVVDVCLHRPGRDVEPGGDLAVSHSSGDQLGNLRFATGQPSPAGHRSPGLQCDGVTPATDGVCARCCTELFDPFAIPAHSEPMAQSLS